MEATSVSGKLARMDKQMRSSEVASATAEYRTETWQGSLDLGPLEFEIRTPVMQSGADCFPRRTQGKQKTNKSHRHFYRQSAFPAMTFSNLQRREAPLSTCNHC